MIIIASFFLNLQNQRMKMLILKMIRICLNYGKHLLASYHIKTMWQGLRILIVLLIAKWIGPLRLAILFAQLCH